MNTDIEDLLREGMERFTRDLRAPAGLTRRDARRCRGRLALRSGAAAASALAAGAVALVAVVVPAALESGAQAPIANTAYLVSRVNSALGAAEPGAIAQVTVTRSAAMPGGKTVTTTADEWSYGDQWRSVTYSRAGQPLYDEGFSASSLYTVVSYKARTWARQPGLGRPNAPVFGGPRLGRLPALFGRLGLRRPAARAFGPLGLGRPDAPVFGRPGLGRPRASFARLGLRRLKPPVPSLRSCEPVVAAVPLLFLPGLPGIGFAASSLPTARAVRNAISCGILAVAGRQRVGGIEAIELTSRPKSPISESIWVTPGTYLPVRVIVRSAPGAPGVLRQTAEITWLPPTAQNLAKLTVPVPAGFRRVPFLSLAQALLPILRQIPGGPRVRASAEG